MRNIQTLLILASVLLNSCNTTKTEESKARTIPFESSISEEKVVEQQKSAKAKVQIKVDKKDLQIFNIEDIPSNWIRLTITDSIPIIYSTCDAGNRLISILKKDKGFNLLMHGQQEDYEFTINDTHINDSGVILIRAAWVNSEDEQEFRFTWIDVQNGLGKWEMISHPNYYDVEQFVSKKFEPNFATVKQPCIECFSPEDCDYFKKMNIQ